MSALTIFAVEQELIQILHEFAIKRDLMGATEEDGRYKFHDPQEEPFDFIQPVGFLTLYLFPRGQALSDPPLEGVVAPKNLGWVDVWTGHLVELPDRAVLTMTTIQASNSAWLDFKPANWLRALKKSLSPSFTFGVFGGDVVRSGGRAYGDIGYSPEALRLYNEGVIWKQFTNDTSKWSPLVE